MMKKNNLITLLLFCLTLSACSDTDPASVKKATMFSEHGLKAEARIELINVIFSKSQNQDKSKAYYLLGGLAFDENRISIALKSWRELAEKYPNSQEAGIVKDRIDELAEIVGESTKESIENAIALSYLRHGDFWSKDKDRMFIIDSSWIPKVETALKWYDKVIIEFPKTNASKIAYQDKMRALLGWKETGRYGDSYGVKKSFPKYMPQLLETFSAFEIEHPKATILQAFRYQIAQAYWKNKNWVETKKWLHLIIEKSGDRDSFYKDTAQRRLKKIEY